MINLLVAVLGVLIGFLIFYKNPVLSDEGTVKSQKTISVIIPARNEQNNLPIILEDLKNQTSAVYEVICVDDASQDNTAAIASSFGAKLISINQKPEGWTGKSWACQCGGNIAKGELLLFLDADVRLGNSAISKLANAYENRQCVISVQPYHVVEKFYEQFSFFFNCILIAANGVGLPYKNKHAGLFGPVILISKEEYISINGHYAVRGSIVDDLSLGEELNAGGKKFSLFLGGTDISFRMYSDGFGQLIQGWTKNFATGAVKTPIILMLMIILWVDSCTSIVINLIKSIADFNLLYLSLYILLYLVFVLQLWIISQRIGSFKKTAILFYPVLLSVFLIIFAYSVFKKIFHINVKWKGRNIKLSR